MSDSSNDGCKDMNKDSEVSSSCSDGRRAQAGEVECDATPAEEPKPRSLSPDTSDVAGSDELAGPSHQAPLFAAANSSGSREGEPSTSTTGHGRSVAVSSHQEAGISSGQISGCSQQEVSSADLDKEETKSSSSDEYFEADASPFEANVDVSGSQDPTLGQEVVESAAEPTPQAWEAQISSESDSEDAAAISSGQSSNMLRQANEATASATLRLPQKSWEMLMSYESSSDDGEAESSNQQSTDAAVSGSHDNAGQACEAREISTTQQPSASTSPSNSQDIIEIEPEVVSGVSASVSSVRELEQERASSSELQLETSAVSGSQDRSEEHVEAGSSSIMQVSGELDPSNSQQFSPESQGDESDDLTSSGQPSTSQEVTESHRISEELSPSHQQLSSSHQVDVSPEEVDADLTSSGQVGSQSLVLDEGNSQEAEASSVSETENVSQPVAGPSSQTVSASDDMGSSSPSLSSSSPQIAERPECSESGQAQQVPGDVSGSSDSPEDEGMSSSTVQASPRPDSPSTQRAAERPVSAAQVVSRVNVTAGSSQSCEGDVEMSSSSGVIPPFQSREVDGAASQSREVGGPSSQSREVEGAVFQSREVDTATSQSREVDGAASQSREVDGAASQSREVDGAASQSREIDGAASQSREVVRAASQSREVETATSQSREVDATASQSREVDATASQSREVDGAGPSVAESSVEASVPISQPPMPSVSSATRERSSDEEPGSASAQQSRPQDPARMSVLAQQLTVSSASGRPSGMLRQLISSLNETGASNRHGSVGPDSTTMDQSNVDAGEEVSTTEEEQPGQVSTSQQRVVSTSWPPHAPSRVSSSADSSGGGHISTSAQLGGLLASRLSRDPQVSTSANAASFPRDHDLREGGASSTTSGLRGLLSSAPRPIGVSSSSRPQLGFSPPSQSCEPSPRLANAEVVVLSQHSTRPNRNTPGNGAQACSSSHEQRLSLHSKPGSSKMLATAPGDQFPNDPDKRSKKRKKSSEKEEPLPPAKHSQPGPSRPAPADLGTSASLVEQLRKAGVIITPVPSAPSHSQQSHQGSLSSMSRPKATMRMKDIAESAVSSPPTSVSISRVTEQIDSSSSDDIQMLEMFGKPNSTPQQSDTGTTGPSPEESVGEEDGQFVLAGEMEAQGHDDPNDPNKRKRRPRKPKEINPEMLRPKRPRKAKEKPESEEDTKEKPKRGRKKKEQVEQPREESKSSEVSAEPEPEPEVVAVIEAVPEVVPSPEKPKGKERAKKSNSKVVGEPPARPQDEDTRMSTISTEDSQQSRPDVAFRKSVLPVLDVHAETLVEYQWPLNDRLAESYMIQEQVIQYLGIKSFKRKYPDLKRRPVEPEEREFLQERGLVAEALCDLGLTAVPSAEVLDVMSADFQEKYEEYRRALRDKQAREVSGKQKAAAAAGGERGRQVDQKLRAMQSAAKWNASLNRERREERRCCCDLQTMSVQFPQTRVKAMTKEVPKLGTYPVSLIPGQFTDFYKRYTPTELRYLPLNTVLYGPMLPNEEMEEKASEGSPSDSEDSSSSDETSSSSSSDGTQDTEETGSTAAEPEQDIPSASAASGPPAGSKCKVCSLPGNHPDSMVVCAQCNSAGHLNCFGLSTDMLPHIRRYAWQCTDCKTCIQCKDPADEDKMLFCDMCDRGYHIYCVGLRKVPDGRWHCQECAVCGSCGSLDPAGTEAASVASPPASPDKIQPQWQHEFKRGEKGARVYAQTLCVPCSRLWRRGSFCQLCLRCFRKPDTSTMLSCSVCDKWMHAECCSLAPGVDAPKMGGSSFVCEVCQEASHVRSAPTTLARIVKVATRV